MCTCTSCKATDALSGWKEVNGRTVPDPKCGGFDRWPRGNPAGPRASAASYAAHVAHGKAGLAAGWAFHPGAAPHYPYMGAPGLPYPSKLVRDFIAAGYDRSKPAVTVAPKLQIVPKPAPAAPLDIADFVKRRLAA